MTNYVCFWTWMLGDGTCHSIVRLVTLKLGLRPSFILNKKLCVFLDLDVGGWDLSIQHWTCHLEAGPSAFGPASFLIRNYVCFWTWMLGDGTCQSSIGLVTLDLGLWPSFVLNVNLCLFLDLDVGRWDLSFQHWICHLEAGPSAQLHS